MVQLSTAAVDEVHCRVQQDTTGHRGRAGEPLYGIRTILGAGQETLSTGNAPGLTAAIDPEPGHSKAHEEVHIAR